MYVIEVKGNRYDGAAWFLYIIVCALVIVSMLTMSVSESSLKMAGFDDIQRRDLFFANLVKQDPGRAR